jgi:hypothetical protein
VNPFVDSMSTEAPPIPILPAADRRCGIFFLSRRVRLAKITASCRKALEGYVPVSALAIFKAPDSILSTKSIFFTFTSVDRPQISPPPHPYLVLYLLNSIFHKIDYGRNFSGEGGHPLATSLYTCRMGLAHLGNALCTISPSVQISVKFGNAFHLSTSIACNLAHPQPPTLSTSSGSRIVLPLV